MRVTLSAIARADLADIEAYYIKRNPRTALKMLRKIQSTIIHLGEHPNVGRPNQRMSCRLFHVPGTHSLLPYRWLGENEIEIMAVFDERQKRPDAWQ